MKVYEVLSEAEAGIFRFTTLDEAMQEAELICRRHHVEVRVVRVIGTYVPSCRWVENSRGREDSYVHASPPREDL